MTKRNIIVGVDFSKYSMAAVEEASWVARRVDAQMVIAHVGSPALPATASMLPSVRVWEEVIEQQSAEEALEAKRLAEKITATGLPTSHRSLIGEPAEQLTQLAKDEGSEMIVVGTHGHTGVQSFLLGSVAQGVVRHAEANVWVARNAKPWQDGPKKILLATDFSTHAEEALRLAIHLAPDESTIDLVHVWQIPVPLAPPGALGAIATPLATLSQDLEKLAAKRGAELVEKYATSRLTLDFSAMTGPAASTVIDYAKRDGANYDLIVMGSHGRRGFRRFFLGSVAESIVRHAPCSALVVHSKPKS